MSEPIGRLLKADFAADRFAVGRKLGELHAAGLIPPGHEPVFTDDPRTGDKVIFTRPAQPAP